MQEAFHKSIVNSIILIDDDDTDLFIHQSILQQSGYKGKLQAFKFATNALTFLKNTSEKNFPQIIFLDIAMPMVDGFMFLAEYASIKQQAIDCDIIVLSSSGNHQDLRIMKNNSHIKHFITKPLTKESLEIALQSINKVLKRQEP